MFQGIQKSQFYFRRDHGCEVTAPLKYSVKLQYFNWQLGLQLNYRKVTIFYNNKRNTNICSLYGTTFSPFLYNKRNCTLFRRTYII